MSNDRRNLLLALGALGVLLVADVGFASAQVNETSETDGTTEDGSAPPAEKKDCPKHAKRGPRGEDAPAREEAPPA